MLPPVLLRLLIVVAVVAAALAVGVWWRGRDGRMTQPARGGMRRRKSPASAKRVSSRDGRFAEEQLAAVGLDGRAGEVRALLLGSPTCAPCRTVRRVLAEVSEARPHFRWVTVDAGDYLDIARDHHVLRVPTLFVIDHDGWILARTSGVPAERDLLKVVDRAAAGIVDSADRVV
ncbi:MAG: thioredoxin family protein [Actinomycetota bacterium]|nr:thioredoxin family protein [Actinomycetota bacterium]